MNLRSKWVSVWAVLALILTVLVGLVYASVQGALRMSANDPQIEIAQEITDAIANGAPAEQLIPLTGGSEIKTSLGVFAAIYDQDGNAIGSSASLNGNNPIPPKGVFERAKESGRNLFTWEPEKNVRIAAVVMPSKSEDKDVYILAGKNIREVEDRIEQIAYISLIAWGALLLLSALFMRMLSGIVAGGISIIEKDTEIVVVEKEAEEIKI